MSNISSDLIGSDLDAIRRRARRGAKAQRVRLMLAAAGLTAFGLVAVAATLLANLI
jgi:hypothetical protein